MRLVDQVLLLLAQVRKRMVTILLQSEHLLEQRSLKQWLLVVIHMPMRRLQHQSGMVH